MEEHALTMDAVATHVLALLAIMEQTVKVRLMSVHQTLAKMEAPVL